MLKNMVAAHVPNRFLISIKLHGITAKKMFFVVTTVTTSNLTKIV
jgi:hypothetical protein